ncbi:MAG: LemA family protein [Gemmatimonadota bacterium]
MNYIFLLLAAGFFGWGMVTYNRLVRLRTLMEGAWADIDVQLTRRHDLIPNLVAAVKGYAGHEQATLKAVTALRDQAEKLDSPARLGQVETQLQGAVMRLLAVKEAYPELMASQNFMELQQDLVDVEDHLQYARRFYNGAVRDFNTAVGSIPDALVARAFLFRPAEFFQAEEGERAAPRLEMES